MDTDICPLVRVEKTGHLKTKKLKFPDCPEILKLKGEFPLFYPYLAIFSDGHMSGLRPNVDGGRVDV